MSRHANISIFVPHIGCTHQCSFCNQYAITAEIGAPHRAEVDAAVLAAQQGRRYDPKNTELAFFGGSFTAIDPGYMKELLQAAQYHLKNGSIAGIRVSTRPDAVSPQILQLLKDSGVTAVELGCQSMRDAVLQKNFRGHTAQDVENACHLIRAFGFSLGLQMMLGLYGDDSAGAIETAQKVVALRPDTVRIYPTLVLKGTRLYRLMQQGKYQPMQLEQAVALTARLLEIFESSNIRVIRVGLHTVERESFVAGPWHPAFGELCAARMLRNKLQCQLQQKQILPGAVQVTVPVGFLSKMLGQHKENIEFFRKMGYNVSVYEAAIDSMIVKGI